MWKFWSRSDRWRTKHRARSRSPAAARHRRIFLERLEDRSLLAPLINITFGGKLTLAADKNLSATVVGEVFVQSGVQLALSGSGSVTLTSAQDFYFASGSSVTTVDGNISLSANQQATPSAVGGFNMAVSTIQ